MAGCPKEASTPSSHDARRPEPSAEVDAVAREVVDAALTVHHTLGPGLLESAYKECLTSELEGRGRPIERECALPLFYRDRRLDAGFRIDLLAANAVVIEVKGIETLLPVHAAQFLTYLKLSHCRVGLLINFNVPLIRQGIRRIIRPL